MVRIRWVNDMSYCAHSNCPALTARKHPLNSVWVPQTLGNTDGTFYCTAKSNINLSYSEIVLRANEGFLIEMQDL